MKTLLVFLIIVYAISVIRVIQVYLKHGLKGFFIYIEPPILSLFGIGTISIIISAIIYSVMYLP